MDPTEFDVPYRSRAQLTPAEVAHRELWVWLRSPDLPVAGWYSAWRTALASRESRSARDELILEIIERAVACLGRGAAVDSSRTGFKATCELDRALLAERDFWDALLAPAAIAKLEEFPVLARLLDVACGRRAMATLPAPYRGLGEALGILRQGFRDPGGAGVAVDLTHYRVWKSGQLTIDRAAVSLIELLTRLRAVSEQSAGLALFGIRRFDDLPHRRRLSNLLCETRKLLPPEATLEYREGTIYALGDWSGISFWRENRLSEALEEYGKSGPVAENSITPRSRTEPIQASDLLQILRTKREWRREELQAELDLSRTGAVRLLQRLVRERRLAPLGEAKRRRYEVLDLSL